MKNICKALSEFQKECPKIPLNKRGFNYSYAPLDVVLSMTKPILRKHNLVVFQSINHNELNNTIKTILCHTESGETLESTMLIPNLEPTTIKKYDKRTQTYYEQFGYLGFETMDLAQVTGSFITYFRRYTYCSLLGIVADEDNDSSGTFESTKKPVKKLSIDNKRHLDSLDSSLGKNAIKGIKEGKVKTMADLEKIFIMSNDVRTQLEILLTAQTN